MKPSVALVDDEAGFQKFVQDIINSSGKYQWAGAYGSGEEALRELSKIHPDIVLMDIVLSGMSGLDCARRLKKERPEIGVIIVSGQVPERGVTEALDTGADGFLRKPFTLEEFFKRIEDVRRGGIGISSGAAKYLVEDWRKGKARLDLERFGITAREWEVLRLVEEGKTQKEIAMILHVSESTVHTHLRTIYGKLGVHNGHEAIAKLRGE